jgi:hypothetical protein
MISKVIDSGSIENATRYVLKKEHSILIGGSMLSKTYQALNQEFHISIDLNPDIEKPCYHFALSYSKTDLEMNELDNDTLAEIATRHFAGMVVSSRNPELLHKKDKEHPEFNKKVDEFIESGEIDQYQFFIALHADTHHCHTHTVASRISVKDSKCINMWYDQNRSQLICRELEQTYGIEKLESSWEVGKRSLTRRQYEKQVETGKQPVQTKLQNLIGNLASNQYITLDELTEQLEKYGVDVRIGHYGNKKGISYKLDGISMSGSQLGKNYTYSGLQTHFGVCVETKLEPLDKILNNQSTYLKQAEALANKIWSREDIARTLTYQKYQLRANSADNDKLELFKRDRKILSWDESKQAYQAYGITQKDIKSLEIWNAHSIQKYQEQEQSGETQEQKRRSLDIER